MEELWVVMGDFNAVRCPEERFNTYFNAGCAEAFNDFIDDNDLLEYPMGCRKFTRVSGSGDKLSKLYRFLVSPSFWNRWPDAAVMALPRCESDHNPIILSTNVSNFGAIPFRFYNSWLGREGLVGVVTNAINGVNCIGPLDVVFAEKLKHIKSDLKAWVISERDKEDLVSKQLESKIRVLEETMEQSILSDTEKHL
ncbi:uncharacterized protein LOC110906961 [Helianthus annuus]|uniref:uncharacterized protein LOC110906961 n=1 Tax=Helianthus annuus TaxID=4232 RepID=UPI000B8FCF0D|nr:uncharacterized protein LOC110906961 [Helianthus annuus]